MLNFFEIYETFSALAVSIIYKQILGGMFMQKEIQGIVRQNPVILEKICVFTVEQDQGFYLVVSTDTQAAKDNIFVENGQEINIRGGYFETLDLKGIVVTNEAAINVSRINLRGELIWSQHQH